MRRIAIAMEDANAEAVRAAASRTAGENIELGLRLGDAALAIAQHRAPRPEEVAPSRLWRERRRKAEGR